MYVANLASDKITQLTDNVYVCRSGSAADTQVISDYVRYFLHQNTIQLGQPATVKVAANLIRLLAYQNKINNANGVKKNFYPGDKLPLWHEEMEPHNSLLDILCSWEPRSRGAVNLQTSRGPFYEPFCT